jgi:tetratricopeptide (TPR) repeat protein
MWLLPILLATSAQMGSLSFSVSGNAACQRQFTDGMLALHSFMYDRAHERFQAAIKADVHCAMARWGDAMAYNHPVWGEDDRPAAKQALDAVLDESKLPKKERAYLATARILFGEGELRPRLHAWLDAAEAMHRDYHDDDEVALQHALSLIANSKRLTDTRVLMRAGAIALDVLARRPQHPGAAHYVIHAFDSPDHAILALPAANRYAAIAPAASHARHMPSHIFVQLGMWDRVASSNEAAWAASQADARGKSIDKYDWHTYAWLAAAYLERGQLQRAQGLVSELRDRLKQHDHPEPRLSYALIASLDAKLAGLTDVEDLLAPISTPLPVEPGDSSGSLGCEQHAPGGKLPGRPPFGLMSLSIGHLTRAEAAMRRGDEAGVQRALEGEPALDRAMAAWTSIAQPGYFDRRKDRRASLVAVARAVHTRREADVAAAIAALKKQIAGDDQASSGPAFETPAQQLLGELQLTFGHSKDALEAFEKVLHEHPRSSQALLGAARSAKALDDAARATGYYATLADLWSQADATLPALAEVRQGALGAAHAAAR